ncbi:MAG TPA: hypothetical protein VGS19_09425 [Streptosporangiaceae bacterium]|nr:hypothetical protein [Streptosporangiaceae bacterium]
MARTTQWLTRWGRRTLVPATLTLCLLSAAAGPALAVWSASGNGNAGAAATTMPAGNAPTVTTSGNNITVQWTVATLPGGVGVEGYIIRRYNAINGAAATVGAACSGVVTSTSCTESGVPSGSWIYTDTPVQGNWTGPESRPSSPATVGTPAVSPQPVASPSPTASRSPTGRPSPTASPSALSADTNVEGGSLAWPCSRPSVR